MRIVADPHDPAAVAYAERFNHMVDQLVNDEQPDNVPSNQGVNPNSLSVIFDVSGVPHESARATAQFREDMTKEGSNFTQNFAHDAQQWRSIYKTAMQNAPSDRIIDGMAGRAIYDPGLTLKTDEGLSVRLIADANDPGARQWLDQLRQAQRPDGTIDCDRLGGKTAKDFLSDRHHIQAVAVDSAGHLDRDGHTLSADQKRNLNGINRLMQDVVPHAMNRDWNAARAAVNAPYERGGATAAVAPPAAGRPTVRAPSA